MANNTNAQSFPSRYGLQGSDNFDLFLKVYGGEVLTAFNHRNIMVGKTTVRRIASGKSAQFPIMGVANAVYHTPGEDILREWTGSANNPKYLQTPGTGEKVIHVDEIALSPVMINDVDNAMSHFDVRAGYSFEQGYALAALIDLNIMKMVFNGAQKSASLTGEGSWGKGGVQLIDSTFTSSASSIKTTIRTAAQRFDENDIPQDGRHFAVGPATYHLLAQEADVLVFGSNTAAATQLRSTTGADVGAGQVLRYHGFNIHMSNRVLELGDFTPITGQRGTDYSGLASDCTGLFWHESAVGTVQRIGIQMQSDYRIEFQALAMVARLMMGHGVLREHACGAVNTATPA